ncbi:MAG: DUF3078 domain-containing protein [Chitinophagaceae bacterium]
MKPYLLLALLLTTTCALAQDEDVRKMRDESTRAIKKTDKDTVELAWKRGGLFSVNLSQGTLRNWAAGGDEFALSINSILSLYAFYKEGRRSWDNTFDFNFGYVNTTSLGARKNDDRIDFLSKYGYGLTEKLNLATLFNFRSQLLKGYNYPDDTTRILTSDFLSPANILLSLGLDYKPNQAFSLFFSPVTARLIVVSDDSLAAKGSYGMEPGNNSKTEFGAFATANYIKEFNKIVSFKSRLDLFSNYRNKPKNIDLFWTNLLSVKLNKALSVSWNVDLIYDDDVRIFGENANAPATQLKSIVGAGLMLNF